MIEYDWNCKKCSHSNPSGTDVCANCDCSAYASVEEVEASHTPDGLNLLKTKKWLEAKIVGLCYLPAFAYMAIDKGYIINFSLILLVLMGVLIKDFNLVQFIYSDRWAKRTLISFSSILVASIAIRRIEEFQSVKGIISLLVFTYAAAMTYYIFRSQAGKDFLGRLHQHRRATN